MARSANSRRGRTGVSSKAGGTHHYYCANDDPKCPTLPSSRKTRSASPLTFRTALARTCIASEFAEVQ